MAAAFPAAGRIRYEDAVAAWAERHILDAVGPRTARRYAVSLKQLEAFVIDLFIDEIDSAKVKEIVDARRAAGVSVATIRRDLTALSSVLRYSEVEPNPALERLKKLTERRDPIVLPDPAHVRMIIARASGRVPAIVEAAWKTGCRLEELAAAERTRLDHSRRQLTVRGKGNKQRVIDLDYDGGYELLRSIPPHLSCKWLFWHGAGEPYRNLSSNFSHLVRAEFLERYDRHHGTNAKTRPPLRQLLRDVGGKEWVDTGFRPFTFHQLRHLHAVEFLKSGRSIYDLQKRLGHRSIKTTELYLEFLTPEEERIVKFGAPGGGLVEQRR